MKETLALDMPVAILRSPRLKAHEKMVYAVMLAYFDDNKSRAPTSAQVATELAAPVAAIDTVYKHLEELGLLKTSIFGQSLEPIPLEFYRETGVKPPETAKKHMAVVACTPDVAIGWFHTAMQTRVGESYVAGNATPAEFAKMKELLVTYKPHVTKLAIERYCEFTRKTPTILGLHSDRSLWFTQAQEALFGKGKTPPPVAATPARAARDEFNPEDMKKAPERGWGT